MIAARPDGGAPQRRVLLVAHWDWVLLQFRMPVARALRDHGWDVMFVCPPGNNVSQLEAEGFAWIPWRVDRRSTNVVREVAAVIRLAAIYRRTRPTVVHHFTVKPNLYGSIVTRWVRVAFTVNTFSGLGYLFSDSPAARRLLRVVAPLMRAAFRRTGVWVLALNEEDLMRLRSLGLALPSRSRVIGEGVDTARFRPATPTPQGVPMVLFAGRLLRDKGVADLVAAARLLQVAGVNCRVVVAGAPDAGNPSSIPEASLAEWRASSPVDFLGQRDDVERLLADAAVAVLPSRHEGSPRFLMEAAAAGLPLVATDIPGCREVVVDGRNGLLVPVGDPPAMADAIARIVNDAALSATMGASSRAMAEERFSESSVVQDYLNLYDGLPAS